jgi:AraC-like DNA-binding protein
MGLIASLPDIENFPASVFVNHETFERHIPMHRHSKGQLSYVEGGLAYIKIGTKTYVVPARHYFWIPAGIDHVLTIGNSAAVLRSLFFYADDDHKYAFYQEMGIYPINELLIQMIKYAQKWDGHVQPANEGYEFLRSIKNVLPEISKKQLHLALPVTDNERMNEIIDFMNKNLSELLFLNTTGDHFGISQRSFSRLFRSNLGISFLQYLKMIRMIKALELILQTDQSLSEIAYQVGYNSLSSFSNTFYQITHARPSTFIAYRSGNA